MPTWWYILIVVILVVLIALIVRSRRQRPRMREPDVAATARNFSEEREDARRTHMSTEDREWEAGSLQRQRDVDRQKQPPDNP